MYKVDTNIYPAPQQIAMYLTHKDVWLGYFDKVQNNMRDLMSGAPLFVMEEGLGNSNRELLVKYSKKFKEDLQDRVSKGFRIQEAKVNFIVYWKDEEKEKEMKIILPQLLFKKDL
jgi:ATP-dependent DNA helicase RecQ